MKKTRRRYDREFKISILAELEAGKQLAQVAREYGIHPSLPCRWRDVLAKYTEKAFLGNGKKYKENENAPDQSKVTCLPYSNPREVMAKKELKRNLQGNSVCFFQRSYSIDTQSLPTLWYKSKWLLQMEKSNRIRNIEQSTRYRSQD